MLNNIIKIFKEISTIPHESGNEKEISNYLVKFAKERNLKYIQDKYNNVVIFKENGKNKTTILQAHMDMVCESINNYDFKNKGIEIIEENGYLKANNTTLGADNGIGLAMILNILDKYDYNIEAVFTVSEETSMIGAEKLDKSILKGNKLINLDGFNNNMITIESGAFNDIVINTNYKKEIKPNNKIYEIKLYGLKGGHSGEEIGNNRGNSILLLNKLLNKFKDIEISKFNGGTKFNVIPSTSSCIISTNCNIEKEINKFLKENIKMNISYKELTDYNELFLSNKESIKLIKSLNTFKNGVRNKHNNFITTSHNLGVFNLDNNEIKIGLRSSRILEEEKDIIYLKEWSKLNKYKFNIIGRQPGFRTRKNSSLVNNLIKYNKNTKIEGTHSALELGFFQEYNKDLEIVVISPLIQFAHTVDERVNIKTIEECNNWLKKYLENIN